ncbi:MAG: ABC transporter ATP-binding protein [Gammaproteobacteria bacterium]
MLVEARALVAGYGKTTILKGVSLSVDSGNIAAIVGPNGAGKSTALKAMFGLLALSSGSVLLGGKPLHGLRADQRVSEGLALVPQSRNIFPSLTVLENLQIGAYQRRDDFSETLAKVFDLFPLLGERRRTPGGQLSGGQRQMLAMGRALMSEPRALLLDEPTAGLSPAVMEQVFDRILAIRDDGVGVLMVEQNARQALALADTGFVLANGENGHTGSGAELLADPAVRASFLGGS